MPRDRPSQEDRQAVQAEIQRLHQDYLEARSKFERVLELVLEGNGHAKSLTALMDAVDARRLAFGRYVAAAATSAGED